MFPACLSNCTIGVVVVKGSEPYDYVLPLASTALIMIDFQRDFMEPGGFGSTLGNNVGLLQVTWWQARSAMQQAHV
jgi:biuret amidohydrolase